MTFQDRDVFSIAAPLASATEKGYHSVCAVFSNAVFEGFSGNPHLSPARLDKKFRSGLIKKSHRGRRTAPITLSRPFWVIGERTCDGHILNYKVHLAWQFLNGLFPVCYKGKMSVEQNTR